VSEFKFKQFTIKQEGAPFKVGTDSMILGSWAQLKGDESALDIGTGTGILALMLAQKLDTGKILAAEPNRTAFEIAKSNFENSPFADRLIAINEPLQNLKPNNKFDVIICNPPYFSDSTLSKESNVSARHTVDLKFNEIAEFSIQNLAKQGRTYVILPVIEFRYFKNEMIQNGFFENHRLEVSSFENSNTKRICASFTKTESQLKIEKLAIRNSNNNLYSSEYQNLVREYQIRF